MTRGQAWAAFVRAENRAQVHIQIAKESIQRALEARRLWEEMEAEDTLVETPRRWPEPMSDSRSTWEQSGQQKDW